MNKGLEKYIIFKVSDSLLATRVADINEMIEYNQPKEIHTDLPEYFEGIFNLRGEIVTAINLKSLLGLKSSEKSTIQVVFGSESNYVAASIDDAETIAEINSHSLIHSADNEFDIPNEFHLGNYQYKNEIVGVFDLKKFLLDTVK